MSALAELGDDEFRDVMKHASWRADRWEAFMADEVIDRTADALRELIAELLVQLTGLKVEEDPDWAKYTRGLLTRLNARRGKVTARVKEMNRQESATAEAYERKWSQFVFTLAETFEDTAAGYLLDETFIPSGEITVRQWMTARRAQAASKIARQAVSA